MIRKARGAHYFELSGLPVTAVRVRIVKGERVSHPHDLTELEHEHDFRELVIVLRGAAQHRLQGQDFRVQSGDVYILQERSRHFFYDIEELDLINIMYDNARLPLPQDQLRQLSGYSALFLLEPQYRKRHQFSSRLQLGPAALQKARVIAEDMVSEVEANQSGGGVMLLSRLLELMAFLSRQYGKATATKSRELLRIGDVISAMERDCARSWSINELSSMAHVSRSTFLRAFEQAMGQPPIAFLIQRRLDAAARMLKATDKTITEIALEVGFSDSNYFARQFFQHRKITPSQYRSA